MKAFKQRDSKKITNFIQSLTLRYVTHPISSNLRHSFTVSVFIYKYYVEHQIKCFKALQNDYHYYFISSQGIHNFNFAKFQHNVCYEWAMYMCTVYINTYDIIVYLLCSKKIFLDWVTFETLNDDFIARQVNECA